MKKVVAFLVSAALLAGCSADGGQSSSAQGNLRSVLSTSSSTSVVSESTSQAIQTIAVDYVEVVHNSESYDSKRISIAGRIGAFSPTSKSEIMIYDRLGFEDAGAGLSVQLSDRTIEARENYKIGEYIVVEGYWRNGIYSGIVDAIVVETGEKAEDIANTYAKIWENDRLDETKELPIIDYTDIINNQSIYEGALVRTGGTIGSISKNNVSGYLFIKFRDRISNMTVFTISLKGVPPEIQEKCTEGQFIIVSGYIDSGDLVDCYVESLGDTAEEAVFNLNQQWESSYEQSRKTFIESCQSYDYDDLARYPDQYIDFPIKVSGTVLQIDQGFGFDRILLTAGVPNQVIYIDYYGRRNSDPRILENDYITIYGVFKGIKSYVTVQNSLKDVPYLEGRFKL